MLIVFGGRARGQAGQLCCTPNQGTINVTENSYNREIFENLGAINLFSYVQLDNYGTINNSNTIKGLVFSVFNNNSGAVINNQWSGHLLIYGTLYNSSILHNYGELYSYGELYGYDSGLINQASGEVDNSGYNATLSSVYGTLQNRGVLNNSNGAHLFNSANAHLINQVLNNSNSATLLNQGYMQNDGLLVNSGAALLTNRGLLVNSSNATLRNLATGQLDNYGTLTNYQGGVLTNSGTLTMYTVILGGESSVLKNYGTLDNWATVNNYYGAISQYGTMTNHAGAIIVNTSYVLNDGTLSNSGTLENWATIQNVGTIRNDATLNDRGVIDNRGQIKNYGDIHLITSHGQATVTGAGGYLQDAPAANTIVDPGGQLYAGWFTQNSGTTRLDNSTLNAPLININGGTLIVDPGGQSLF